MENKWPNFLCKFQCYSHFIRYLQLPFHMSVLVILASDVWNTVLPLNTLKNIFLKLKYVIIQDDEKDVQPKKLQNIYQYIALHNKDFYGDCPKECWMFSTLTSFHNSWHAECFLSLTLPVSWKGATEQNTVDSSCIWDLGKALLQSFWYFK